MRIIVFDSGIGGLNILAAARRRLPDADWVYLADAANAPYGTKTAEWVRELVCATVAGLAEEFRPDMLVIACNTATAVAAETLRASYPMPIVGLEPAVKPAVHQHHHDGKRVLVMATELTLKERKFRDLVYREDAEGIVDTLAMGGLVTLADSLRFDGPEAEDYVRGRLAGTDLSRVGTVVLGCTHFYYFRPLLARFLPEGIDIIDSTEGTVNRILRLAEGLEDAGRGGGTLTLCSSDPRKLPTGRLQTIYDTLTNRRNQQT